MIEKQLTSMLSKRLSELSCNREKFAKTATPCNIAMKTGGYQEDLLSTTMLQIPVQKEIASAM